MVGAERVGKSTLAYMLGRKLDPWFDHTRMVFSGEQFMRLAVTLPKGSVLVLDESISGGFSRDAMSTFNKRLAKFLVVCGERNLILFILFPNRNWLDGYIKDHRSQWEINVKKRGRAVIRKPLRSDFGSGTFWEDWLWFNFPKVDPEKDADFNAYLEAKHAMVGEQGDRVVPNGSEEEDEGKHVEKLGVLLGEVYRDGGLGVKA
jgi:hypothetical protein